MTDRPLVTFFVMAYRQEALVREAIESAFAQTWSPLEIILSDDCSPDGTFRIMEEMAAAYDGPHKVILNRNQANLGVCGHLDQIMALASGAFVVQNAGDDVSAPQRAARLLEAWLASGRRAKLIHSRALLIGADGTPRGFKDPSPRLLADPSARGILKGHLYALGAACGWDRALWDVFGPLGPDLGVEDTVLPLRAALLGEVAHLPEPLVSWREGGLSWHSRETTTGRDYMFGGRLKVLRWRVQSHRRIAADLARAPAETPDLAGLIALNARLAERVEFEVAAADAGSAGRLAMAVRALRLSARRRDASFARQWLKYLLAPLYIRYLEHRYRPEDLRW